MAKTMGAAANRAVRAGGASKEASTGVKGKLRAQSKTLTLRDGRLRIVIVADTHSEPHSRTDELIGSMKPDHILHAGDIGDLAVIDQLARLAPTSVVRGNIDVHAETLPDLLTIGVEEEDGDELFKLLLLHIGVAGPRIRPDAARLARDGGASLVVCGHSHVPFLGRDKGLSVFNPGLIGHGVSSCRSSSA